MQSHSRDPEDTSSPIAGAQSAQAVERRREAELTAIALLCLTFVWPSGEPRRPDLQVVSERA